MDLLHGINFVLVLAIAHQLLDGGKARRRDRVPLLLAVAGTCGAGFLSELGNSIGRQHDLAAGAVVAVNCNQAVEALQRHLPRNLAEALLWPFGFTANFTRVSELVLKPAVIPVLYLAAIVFGICWLVEPASGRSGRCRRARASCWCSARSPTWPG